MDRQYLKLLWQLLLLILCFFGINQLLMLYVFPESKKEELYYTLPELYFFFAFTSFAILIVLLVLKKKNPEMIGYAFLGLSSIKLALCYFMLHHAESQVGKVGHFEKINFFAVFIIFLATEVVMTSKLLKDVGKID